MSNFDNINKQFNEAIEVYGPLQILRELTPLDGAISYIGTENSHRLDICPDYKCSEHQLWKGKGNFELFKEANGSGYCYKCQERFSMFDYLMVYNGYEFKDAVKEIKHHIGFLVDPDYVPKRTTPKALAPLLPSPKEMTKAKYARRKMNTLWNESYPLWDEKALPAALYLMKRGISSLPSALNGMVRCHLGTPFYIPIPTASDDRSDEDRISREQLIHYCANHPSFVSFQYKKGEPKLANMGNHPTLLIMVMTPDGEPRRLHRIFIDEDGNKASFNKDGFEIKRMMPGGIGLEITGCACYIDEPSIVRGVGEGLETVLAVKSVSGMPMDCAINAGGLKKYIPQKGTEYLFIFEDKDASNTGQIAALALEERMLEQGIKAIRITPPIELGNSKSVDWLDVLNQCGRAGFPHVVLAWHELLAA